MFITGFIALSFLAVASSHPIKTKELTFNKFPTKTDKDVKRSESFKAILDFGKFLDTEKDEDATVTISSNEALTFFRQLNSLTSEALEHIASYVKKFAIENPTKETLKRYETATAMLKSLDRSKKIYDEAVAERSFLTKAVGLAKKYGPTALKVGKAVYGALKSDEQTPDDVLLMDEDTEEMIQAKIKWGNVWQGVKEFGKGVYKGATSDEAMNMDADDEDTEDEIAESDVLQQRKICLWIVCIGDTEQQDTPSKPLKSKVLVRAETDIKIAARALAKGGPFSDLLADPEARFDWSKVGQIASQAAGAIGTVFG